MLSRQIELPVDDTPGRTNINFTSFSNARQAGYAGEARYREAGRAQRWTPRVLRTPDRRRLYMQTQPCALRALTLCDGQRLEVSPDALTSCLCWLQERAEAAELHRIASAAAAEREAIVAQLWANERSSSSGLLDRDRTDADVPRR